MDEYWKENGHGRIMVIKTHALTRRTLYELLMQTPLCTYVYLCIGVYGGLDYSIAPVKCAME